MRLPPARSRIGTGESEIKDGRVSAGVFRFLTAPTKMERQRPKKKRKGADLAGLPRLGSFRREQNLMEKEGPEQEEDECRAFCSLSRVYVSLGMKP